MSGRGVLVLFPLQVPTYFNAGHHLALYQVAGYLNGRPDIGRVEVVDGAVGQATWKDLAQLLVTGDFDVVAVMNDLEGLDGTERTLAYIRRLAPGAHAVSFGRMTGTIPAVMKGFDFDAVVETGDFETGVEAAVHALWAGHREAPGVAFRVGGDWLGPEERGTRLEPEQWYLPAPSELPYERYDALYGTDSRRFSGLPAQRELVVPVARGCPIGCDFCEVPVVFGLREKRLSVEATIGYIDRCFTDAHFDYVSFYAPTFTLDRGWVIELCERLQDRKTPTAWKCCTTLRHLDRELVAAMGASGCVRISVGLETLEPRGLELLPVAKAKGATRLQDVVTWCRDAGIELNCFVVVGLPGTTMADAVGTLRQLQDLGARARPTLYTDWQAMRPGADETELVLCNRHILPDSALLDEHERALAHRLAISGEPPPRHDGEI